MRFHRYLLAATLVVTAAAADQPLLPDAPAKATLQKICGTCHEIETVIASRRTKAGWEHMVDDMVDRGAEGSEEDMTAIVDYLTTNFGKVNVNTASAPELMKFLGLSEKEAHAVTTYREQSGAIKDFDQLQKVPGVDVQKLRSKRSSIAFSQ
jgi:competence ComEA-like helix-hairpin-helix protein